VWLERKIAARVRQSDEYFTLSAQSGLKLLQDEVSLQGGEAGVWTSLVWPLSGGQDPDEAFSSVPYEKGFNLLHYLETLVGGVVFGAFAQAYINKCVASSCDLCVCIILFPSIIYSDSSSPR
jgi:leukotriene-A4 hydrolase